MIVYGIKSCDKVRALRKKLNEQGLQYQYRDFRDEPLSIQEIVGWLDQIPAGEAVNKRSTSWKTLNPEQRDLLTHKAGDKLQQAELLSAYPTLFKRPVMASDDQLVFAYSG